MSVIQDVFNVMVFIVLLTSVVWYVLLARNYISDLENWGFTPNEDKTALLVNSSDLVIYDEGRMSKAQLLLSAYVWDTKALQANTIVYATAEVKTTNVTDVLVFTPQYSIEIDGDYRAVKMPIVKSLANIIRNATTTEFVHMFVPDAPAYVSGSSDIIPLMYSYSVDTGLRNYGTKLKHFSSGDYLDSDTVLSARYGNQGDSDAHISGFSSGWKGFVVDEITAHWVVIIN